jgi:hypothetical protein
MNAITWKWRGKTINGRFLQWATQDLEDGCRLISIQAMDESHEMRFPPEDDFAPSPGWKGGASFGFANRANVKKRSQKIMELNESKRRPACDNPHAAAWRDAERARQVEASRLEGLRESRRREWTALVSEHRTASEKLRHDQQVERDHHSQFPSQPAGMTGKHAKVRRDMDAKHKLSGRHSRASTQTI